MVRDDAKECVDEWIEMRIGLGERTKEEEKERDNTRRDEVGVGGREEVEETDGVEENQLL